MNEETLSTARTPPDPTTLPVVGSAVAAIRGGLEFTERMAREYGDVVASTNAVPADLIAVRFERR